ncbi:MAG TPA: DUF3551 domain-containing protein [Pseudolabrys sp.]|nr:DUF3551 domain-containing protein [Pseudolabrys sp.]
MALSTAVTLAAMTSLPTAAAAIEYPWCAQYSRDGGRNCGFVSFGQCMETARGAGAFCVPNLFYWDAASMQPQRKRRHLGN